MKCPSKTLTRLSIALAGISRSGYVVTATKHVHSL